MRHNSIDLTPKQLEIVIYLVRVRGATINQLVNGIDSISTKSSSWETRKARMYEKTNKLLKKGFLAKLATENPSGNLFYLTNYGLEEIYNYLDIEPGYVGKGFFDDFGDIPHEIHKPKRASKHFLLQTELYNTVLNLKSENPGVFDYRDNLYASVSEVFEKATVKVKPDAELLIDDDLYVIEADRNNERGVALNKKFSLYAQYFKQLKSKNKKLPTGIIVVFDNDKKGTRSNMRYKTERFISFYNAFNVECLAFINEVRLIFYEFDNFKIGLHSLIKQRSDLTHERLFNLILASVPSRIEVTKGFFEDHFSIRTKDGLRYKYLIFLESEGYDSLPWTTGYKTYEHMLAERGPESDHSEKGDIYFICVYNIFQTRLPVLRNFKTKQKSLTESKFYQNLFFLDESLSVKCKCLKCEACDKLKQQNIDDVCAICISKELTKVCTACEKVKWIKPTWFNNDYHEIKQLPFLN